MVVVVVYYDGDSISGAWVGCGESVCVIWAHLHTSVAWSFMLLLHCWRSLMCWYSYLVHRSANDFWTLMKISVFFNCFKFEVYTLVMIRYMQGLDFDTTMHYITKRFKSCHLDKFI